MIQCNADSLSVAFVKQLNKPVIGLGGYLIMNEELDYRDLVTFILYITAFISPMRKLSTLSEQFTTGFAGLKRFVEVMATEPTLRDAEDATELKNVEGHIQVEDVSFSYGKDIRSVTQKSLRKSISVGRKRRQITLLR